jgi:hypothetical protein
VSARDGLRLAVVLVGLMFASPAAAVARGDAPPAGEQALSVLGQVSRWAFVTSPEEVRRAPAARSGKLGRLSLLTADGTSELVELLAQRRVHGRLWVKVRTSLRRTDQTGWVPRPALSAFHSVRSWLIVDKRTLKATLIRDGTVIFDAPVGVGKPSTPTPDGTFYIRDRLSGFAPGSIYGPLAFGTSAHSPVLTDWPGGAVVGIHGTNEPQLIPGRVSHGCIRMRNADILRLGRLIGAGTPVTIR